MFAMSSSQRSPKSSVRSLDVAERAMATRESIIAAARRLFVEKGYFATGTEEIVQAAGVGTRGALYHHFTDKRDVFLAVYDQVNEEVNVASQVNAKGDALSRLTAGLIGLFDASLNPEVQQITLIDGPAVLGLEARSYHTQQRGLGVMRALLTQCVAEGTLAPMKIEAMTHLLLAACQEATRYVATSENPIKARAEAIASVKMLLNGLAPKP